MSDKIEKIIENAERFADSAVDAWEEVISSQTDRTGHVAARVASALANNVDADVIALQMTNNSRRINPDAPEIFTEQDVFSIAKCHRSNRTTSVFPKAQAGALIRTQKAASGSDGVAPAF